MSRKKFFDRVYEVQGKAPWTKPFFKNGQYFVPIELINAIRKWKIIPCKTLDIACGEGIHSVYLARQGFEVTGIDYSEKAIEYAQQNAEKLGIDINFWVEDVRNIKKIGGKFDFVVEFAYLHHRPKREWRKHFKDVSSVMNDKGRYLITCFNERTVFRGVKTNNMKLYPSKFKEIKALLEKNFIVLDGEIIEKINEENRSSLFNCFLVQKDHFKNNSILQNLIGYFS